MKSRWFLPVPTTSLKAMQLCDEMRRGELVHAVAVQAGVEIEAHQDRVVMWRDVDAEPPEHDHVVFEVVPDLEHRRILEQRLELLERDRRA